ncbi:flagellar hook-basal body complex protein FliE [Geothrix sp. PMB-07]|uniref:flagellar hook-basal body complex protein FliE n=1 Tax=Geothrix sp. PMB-07 TaxID=3068640 RepID=UPI0027413EE9|nr:flagellar hook-basal body complex protein FliE [Geothrix sp. PMB-07]WLT32466.1 flagellar hook-basal body complex protein FliE [Geothrix sp. PMB-07]
MDPLQNIPPMNPLQALTGTAKSGQDSGAAGTEGGVAFGDLLKQALQEVNQASSQAEDEARNLMTGESADMHTAMLAVQKADLSFQMMMAVRSKLIDAYREVMRMQM